MASLPPCLSDRPGDESYRTLYVPQSFVDSAPPVALVSWSQKLCCTFNRLAITTEAVPFLITYDGGKRTYGGASTFVAAATAAHADVCGMSMGSQDCSNGAVCIAESEAMLEASSGWPPASASPSPEPETLVCCQAIAVCPRVECWAGFDCYEIKECCDINRCQGPAPYIIIIVGAVVLLCGAAATMWTVRRRARSRQPRLVTSTGVALGEQPIPRGV